MNTTAAALVTDAMQRVQALSPTEFAAEVDGGGAVVVDLREPEERLRDGSIRGAIHIPRGMLEFRADPSSSYYDDRLRTDRRLLLFCASGGRSALAAATLAGLGYTNVAHLDGGIGAWSASALPLYGRQVQPY